MIHRIFSCGTYGLRLYKDTLRRIFSSIQCLLEIGSHKKDRSRIKMTGTSVSATFLLLVAMTSACLITNCPRGGKRSGARPATGVDDNTVERPICTLCGPTDKGGICFGPAVCCSPLEGCQVGGPYARACLNTRSVPPLCRMPPQSLPAEPTLTVRCGAGYCTPNGLCCTAEWCRADERCQPTSAEDSSDINLVADRSLQSTLQRGTESEQETSYNEWHPAENAPRSATKAFHI